MNDPTYLSPKMVQAVYGVKSNTSARWRVNGVGPSYYKLEGIIMYRRSDLDKYFEEHLVRCYTLDWQGGEVTKDKLLLTGIPDHPGSPYRFGHTSHQSCSL